MTDNTVTSFTLPSEIVNAEMAANYVAKWEKMNRSLPQSAPSKMKKAYVARLIEAREILARYTAQA